MKISKFLHVTSVIIGLSGVFAFVSAVWGGDNSIFGITKFDALLCAGILMLIAIWAEVGTIHHMSLEEKGEIV